MGRAAGDSAHYTWRLTGTRRGEDYVQAYPSVTHCMKSVRDEMGFGGMAWWGYKIGIRSQYPDATDDEIDVLYEAAKETEWTPNKVRDQRGAEGTEGHDLLEQLALGTVTAYQDGDIYVVGEDPRLIAKLQGLKQEGAEDTQYEPEGHQLSGAQWWLDHEDLFKGRTYPERPVWSVFDRFNGTMDFAWELEHPEGPGFFEVIDYKTHKPAQGMHKDGSYAEGKGPAYMEDLWQEEAYARAFEDLWMGRVVSTRVVLLGPGEPFPTEKLYLEDTRRGDYQAFLNIKAVHDDICRKVECRMVAGRR